VTRELAVDLRAVHKRFGSVHALRGAELKVPRGSIFALIGPNGAGKTTLFGLCCGFLRADAGTVEILGGAPDSLRLKGRLGALPQDAMLGRDITIREHLVFLARLQGMALAQAQSEAMRVLELVDLAELAERRAGALSHGQVKRVGVAQAFLGEPELILLDEPTAGLDPRHAHDLRAMIRGRRGAQTIVVSSHNLQELEAICDEAAFMEKGQTIEAGAIETLTARDAEIHVQLAPGPEPIELLRARVPALALTWDPRQPHPAPALPAGPRARRRGRDRRGPARAARRRRPHLRARQGPLARAALPRPGPGRMTDGTGPFRPVPSDIC
jgi:ABC-2 type transport system ATP-binding protein